VLQYANEPVQQRRQGELTVVIHTRDAAARNIKTGDYVRVFNDRGSFEGRAQVGDDVLEGLAAANVGYWLSLNRSGSAVNGTTSSVHCNLGGAGSQGDNRVQIAKA
jgi:anaerobic selenocysteine-containing dehydrogenase